MRYIAIKIRSQTASFRDPDFQNFHKTLFLPPPTTIIGILGAALGISAKAAQEYFERDKFLFGVYGLPGGIAKDLWKYSCFGSGVYKSSIIHRELLFKNTIYIVVGCENEDKYSEIFAAIESPKYALTLGNSDSLAYIEKIIEIDNEIKSNKLANCMVKGDILTKVINNADNNMEFSIYSTSDPIAHLLPVKFEYKNEYDVRKVITRQVFSFIGDEMLLNYYEKGIVVDEIFIPTYEI